MDKIEIKNIFAAVFDKSVLDPLLEVLDPEAVRFWGTEGTVKYLKSKGFRTRSVVSGFDFDGRVKTLDRCVFVRILADRTNKRHLEKLKELTYGVIARSTVTKQSVDRHVKFDSTRDDRKVDPFDAVIVDLYKPEPKNFPETMDIGGQALIRAAVKNYRNVALAFDKKSIDNLALEVEESGGSTALQFRRKQAARAVKFVAERCRLEASLKL